MGRIADTSIGIGTTLVITWYSSSNCAKITFFLIETLQICVKRNKRHQSFTALVFISFGNCSYIYNYWYEFCVSLKSAPRYINAMRPGRLYGNLLTWKLKRPWLAYLITSTLPLSMILGSLSLSPTIGVGFGCRRAHLECMRTRGEHIEKCKDQRDWGMNWKRQIELNRNRGASVPACP